MPDYYNMIDVDPRFFERFYWIVERRQGDDSVITLTVIGRVIATKDFSGLEPYAIFTAFEDGWQYYAPSAFIKLIENDVFFDEPD